MTATTTAGSRVFLPLTLRRPTETVTTPGSLASSAAYSSQAAWVSSFHATIRHLLPRSCGLRAGASALGRDYTTRLLSTQAAAAGRADAEGGNRTHTPRGEPDFESGASASSATSAGRSLLSQCSAAARS